MSDEASALSSNEDISVESLLATATRTESTEIERSLANQCLRLLDRLMRARETREHVALVQAIRERHDRVSKLLWSGAPGVVLGPMDADAAHADRGTLLSLLTPEHRGALKAKESQGPYAPEKLLLYLVQDMEQIGTETVWLSRARDHLFRTGYLPT
jgi:hypothetical protein